MLHSFAGQAAIALELAETPEGRRAAGPAGGSRPDRQGPARRGDPAAVRGRDDADEHRAAGRSGPRRPRGCRTRSTSWTRPSGRSARRSSPCRAPARTATPSLRAQIVELVEGARGHLGFMPGLSMEGQLDNRGAAADRRAAARRAARGAVQRGAPCQGVQGRGVGGGRQERLILTVDDNGVGLPPTAGAAGCATCRNGPSGSAALSRSAPRRRAGPGCCGASRSVRAGRR